MHQYKHQLIVAVAILAHGATAFADETAAEALKRGASAMKAGRIHEACSAYEAAAKLDDKVENHLMLADCYAQDGKPATAAKLYRSLSDSDSNASRKKSSAAKASKLEAKSPKLRLAINPSPPGIVVKVDGVEVSPTGDVLVDLGPHEVVATAPGFEGRASAPIDRDRAILDVIVRMQPVASQDPAPAASSAAPAPAPAHTASAEPESAAAAPSGGGMAAMPMDKAPTSHRKRNGIILGAGGAAVLVGAGVLFGLSASKFSDQDDLCPNKQCASPDDVPRADQLADDGRTLRGISYGMGIGGVALLGAGVYLIATNNKHASHVAVQVQPGYQGIGYTARW
jgi:hypothetical protein